VRNALRLLCACETCLAVLCCSLVQELKAKPTEEALRAAAAADADGEIRPAAAAASQAQAQPAEEEESGSGS
jgi:hypothetical protein